METESTEKKFIETISEALQQVGVRPHRQEELAIHAVIHFSKTDDCIYLEGNAEDGCHLTITLHTDWKTLANEFDKFGEDFSNEQEKAAALLSHASWMAAPVLRSLLKNCSIEQCGSPHRTEDGIEYVFFLEKCDSCADILRQFFLNADGAGKILSHHPKKRINQN